MASTPPIPPPGWYNDPAGAPVFRWWDGRAWSEHTQPWPPPARAEPQAPMARRLEDWEPGMKLEHAASRSTKVGLWVLLGITAAVVIGFLLQRAAFELMF
ncbi:DUF2510 domain-containing protein [Agromyces aerolatus]|uniref:DUF2510 domain-containing protein n=1 Tax=Agromyces sp. LY-1074 TaxID=3074080 RepID=UPI002866F774|nr:MULTISPECIES: DUF2510 domain-containing protein [unclassified Agromyces]MDR5698499.1 DUF2510 domain-containing protein [Agromyces sp. LY-1074]MDR5704793.1 DUF2510 domain-containing protein [Agromyces sp. LY-1358]